MDSSKKRIEYLKKKLLSETRRFLIYTLFFTLLLSSFINYRRLVLDEYAVPIKIHYGYAIIQAFILAKIIMIGQYFGVGRRFVHKPLIYTILFKTFIFCLLVVVLSIAERFIIGFFKEVSPVYVYQTIIHSNIYEIFSRALIMFFVFLFFFLFLESAQILGNDKVISLFFKKPKT